MLPRDKRVGDERGAVEVFFMHIDARDLTVLVGGVVVDAFVRVAARGLNGVFKAVGDFAASFLLCNGF